MELTHIRCRRRGAYSVRAQGLFSPTGLSYGDVVLQVSPNGTWEIVLDRQYANRDPITIDALIAPALMDAHVHVYRDIDMAAFAQFGICRIRDLGSAPGVIQSLIRTEGCSSEPEILIGGPVLDRQGAPRLPSATSWRDQADIETFLDSQQMQEATWVKVYAGFPTVTLKWLVAEAHSRDLRVAIHARPRNIEPALHSGVDEVEHIATLSGIIRTTEGGLAKSIQAWSSPIRTDELDLLSSCLSSTALCPTLAAYEGLLAIASGNYPVGAPVQLLDQWRRLRVFAEAWPTDMINNILRMVDNTSRCAVELYARGVKIAVGSDTPNPGVLPGFGLWREVNLLVQAGLPVLAPYMMASVQPTGIACSGTHDLAFISTGVIRRALNIHSWPVEPVPAIVRNGCLFINPIVQCTESQGGGHDDTTSE